MDFTETGINLSDSPISSKDQQQQSYSSLDSHLIRLRSQILESDYRKTDLITAIHRFSRERDALKQRNWELEAEMKEGETKKKSRLLFKIVESVRSVEDVLSKTNEYLKDENDPQGGRVREMESEESVLELIKEVKMKVETLMEKTMELSTSVELLEEENKDMNVLLKAALCEKQCAEKQLKEHKRSALMQMAERGLQRIGFGFGFRESMQESSEMEEDENGVTVVLAVEKTMKNLRKEISQLKLSLEESRSEEERLKKMTEEQAQKLEETAMCTEKMQNRERFLTQNVEELGKIIREAESEISRWREACELEVEAGQREVTERDQLIAVLKTEVEKMRSALAISQGKLKLKEELAKAAMGAEEAAEKSLQLAERRISELLSRNEHLYRQLEEAECREERSRKLRYIWCWPLWRFPNSIASGTSSSYTSNRALLRYGG